MKYLPLLWAGLWRKPTRTTLTVPSIAVAFVLYGILSGIDAGFAHSLAASRLDRLFTGSRFGAPMQFAYAAQIARVPGVLVVAPRRGLLGRQIRLEDRRQNSAADRYRAEGRQQ